MHDLAPATTPVRSDPTHLAPSYAVALLDLLDTAAAIVDAEGIVRWCNGALTRLYDRPLEAIVDRPVTDLHDPDDNPYDHPDALRLEQEPTAVYRFGRTVGTRTLTHLLRVIPAAGDDPRCYLLEVLADPPPSLVRPGLFAEAALTAEGRLLTANEGFARLAGERVHRLTGRPLAELAGERDADTVRAAVAQVAGGAVEAVTIEIRLARNDARPSWAELDLQAGPSGTVLVRGRDVTERKRDQLLLSEVFDRAPQPYALVGPDGRILSANPVWRTRLAGGDEPAGTDADLFELVATDARSHLRQAIAGAAAGRLAGFELVALIERDPGAPFLARLRATALHDLSARLDRLLISVEDLTDHALEVESARRGATHTRAVLDAVDVAVVRHDADGTISEINLGAHRAFGSASSDLIGRSSLPAGWQACAADGTALRPEDHPAQLVLRGERPEATAVIGLRPHSPRPGETAGEQTRWYLAHARRLTDVFGTDTGAVTTYTDVSDLRRDLERAGDSRRVALHTFDALPIAAYEAAADRTPRYFNAALGRLVGPHGAPAPDRDEPDPGAMVIDLTDETTSQSRPRTVGDLLDLVHPEDRAAAAAAFDDASTRRMPVRFHHRLAEAHDHDCPWVDHQVAPVVDGDRVEAFVGVLVPVPEWVARGDRTRRLVHLVETGHDLVGEYDVETRRIDYLNARAIEVFEAGDHRLDRLRLSDLYGPDAVLLFRSVIWPALREHSRWEGELAMTTAAGRTIDVQQWITAERDGNGRIVRLVATGHDVTARSRREAELARRATHDPLTGLPNRSLLLERLDSALGRARRNGRSVGLAFIDLDRFKQINDRHGHDGGDLLLVQVANRIESVLRPNDLVARLGGDEFVVLCEDVQDGQAARALAERVTTAVGDRPYLLGTTTVRISASLGLALSSGFDAPESLLRDADVALYRAKDGGRARIEVFDESMRDQSTNRGILGEELQAGLRSGTIGVHYQPAIDLRSGQVRAVAALPRWQHPTRGLLQPSDFDDVAEAAGLTMALCESVLLDAAVRARGWEQRFGATAPVVQINLSPRQLADHDLVDTVSTVLTTTGLRPSLLCLGLTEAALVADTEHVAGTARDLKALGVGLALEELGTDRSPLRLLAELPLDVVVVDRRFVEGLDPTRPESATMAATVVSLGHAMGVTVLAAGLTTVTQLAELHRLGCDAALGYYFSPPLEGDAVDTYLAHRLLPRSADHDHDLGHDAG